MDGESRVEAPASPVDNRHELVAPIESKDDAARGAILALPHQRSWGSGIEEVARHRDRKYIFDSQESMVGRHVLVRNRNPVPLGKEANRF